ncbi:MAG TPA: hypothetical protein VLX68_03750 [Chitinivibrionales bacterium]|nr:hypothetical protein [Chitinivibrionales bacterium]
MEPGGNFEIQTNKKHNLVLHEDDEITEKGNKVYFLWAFELKLGIPDYENYPDVANPPTRDEKEKKIYETAKQLFHSWEDDITRAKKKHGEENVYVRGIENVAVYKDFQKAFTDREAIIIVVAAHGWPEGGFEMVHGSTPFYPNYAKQLKNLKLLVLESCFQGIKANRRLWSQYTNVIMENIIGWVGLNRELILQTAIDWNKGKGISPDITNDKFHSLREAIEKAETQVINNP